LSSALLLKEPDRELSELTKRYGSPQRQGMNSRDHALFEFARLRHRR
jgi:hypothetical protein